MIGVRALLVALIVFLAQDFALHSPRLGASEGQSPAANTLTAGEGHPDSAIVASPAFSDKTLSALPTSGWLKNGGNLFNQNYSPLTQMNRQNVANVKAVWRTHLDGSGLKAKYSGEAQPVVYEGVIYVVTGADDVFAIRVKTGERI